MGQTTNLLSIFAQQPEPFKEPDRDVQSLLNLGHVRAEIEFLADVILCKQKMEVSQIHNKEFHGNCSISKGCNLPSHLTQSAISAKEKRFTRNQCHRPMDLLGHSVSGAVTCGD
ncbi:hypothetical protein L3X38_019301 [Prunus dulcis]|uniref:Uncharacterized protein n=1 Tax=Prunus dulcis TaxID=3755 RepID=A0AAD4ZAX9_PRUDU|nr:hypothetical protein L3X38_019301 [Prunus dulcis]